MNKSTKNTLIQSAINTLGVLVFLKLFKEIDWTWWQVLSPIWISLGIYLLITAAILIDHVRS